MRLAGGLDSLPNRAGLHYDVAPNHDDGENAESRFSRAISLWSMLEVLLLGVFVAYTKLGSLVQMDIGPAVHALQNGARPVVKPTASASGHSPCRTNSIGPEMSVVS